MCHHYISVDQMLALYDKYKLEGRVDEIKTLIKYNSDIRRKEKIPLTHSILIPCYKPHLNKLQRLLDCITGQTLPPDEIIIFTSQTTKNDILHLNLPHNASIYFTARIVGVSEARNKLYHLSTCDVLSFFDADDIMHSKRCEYVMRGIAEDGYDILLTRYQYSLHSYDIPEPEPYSILPTYDGKNPGEYQHGHPTLIRTVMDKVKYVEGLSEGEDVTFLYHVIKAGFKAGKIPAVLTCYDYADGTIIGRLVGGLGNQLFIIAKTLYEANRIRKPYSFILSEHEKSQGYNSSKYKRLLKNVIGNQFNEGQYHINLHERTWSYYDAREEIDNAIRQCGNVVLNGYWQSERHFPSMRDTMRKFLHIQDGLLDGCLIMVRRGDYLKYAHIHNPCPLEYYKNAIDIMKNKGITKFYITSDDIEWCKENLKDIEILDMDDEDLFYYACKFEHFIISNSSYHWMVSYLANSKNVIAPSQWIILPNIDCSSVYRDNMLILQR